MSADKKQSDRTQTPADDTQDRQQLQETQDLDPQDLHDERLAQILDSGKKTDEEVSETISWAPDAEVAELQPVVDKLKRMSKIISQVNDQHCLGGEPVPSSPQGSPKKHSGVEKPTTSSTPEAIGKYRIREVLGQGGQASAFLAFDPDLRRHIVLKVYHAATTEDQQEQVLKEGRHLVRVSSNNVAQCFGADRVDGSPYLVMEYIRGETLAEQFAEQRPTVATSLEIVREVTQGLVAIHAAGLIHRDIKPGNIILGDDGHPRLVDFGLASHLASDDLNRISGTPRYMPPEQARGELERVDHRSDLFGLGAVLYELLTGRAPFDASTPHAALDLARRGKVVPAITFAPETPPAVNELCMKCLAAAPDNRPDSAKELLNELEALTAPRVNSAQSTRGKAVLASSVVAAVTVVLLALWQPWRDRSTNPANPTNPSNPAIDSSSTPADSSGELVLAQSKSRQTPALPQKKATGVDTRIKTTNSLAEHPDDGRSLRRDFPLQVRIIGADMHDGQAVLKEGDLIAIELQSERTCHVGVWSVEPSAVTQLFPNDAEPDGKLKAAAPRVVPAEESKTDAEPQQIRVTPSSGREFLHVVACTKPLPEVEGQSFGPYVVFTSEAQRGQWKHRLRGLINEPRVASDDSDPAGPLLVSEFILPYQVTPKPAADQ